MFKIFRTFNTLKSTKSTNVKHNFSHFDINKDKMHILNKKDFEKKLPNFKPYLTTEYSGGDIIYSDGLDIKFNSTYIDILDQKYIFKNDNYIKNIIQISFLDDVLFYLHETKIKVNVNKLLVDKILDKKTFYSNLTI